MSLLQELRPALEHPKLRVFLRGFLTILLMGGVLAAPGFLLDVAWAWIGLAIVSSVALLAALAVGIFVLARVKTALDYEKVLAARAFEKIVDDLDSVRSELGQRSDELRVAGEPSRPGTAEDLEEVAARVSAIERHVAEALSNLEQLARLQWDRVAAVEGHLASGSGTLREQIDAARAELQSFADGLQRSRLDSKGRLNDTANSLAGRPDAAKVGRSSVSKRLDREDDDRWQRERSSQQGDREDSWPKAEGSIQQVEQALASLRTLLRETARSELPSRKEEVEGGQSRT